MQTETETTETPAQAIDRVAGELGLTMSASFVPWSQSRNAKEKSPSLNWQVTISKNGRAILSTDYDAGCGHCPASKASVKRAGSHGSVMRESMIKWECENGKAAWCIESIDHISGIGKPLLPEFRDVLASLSMDSDVLDAGEFEEWASNLGYDSDSRKAESIYRACLNIALKLRASLGDDGLARLRAACEGY